MKEEIEEVDLSFDPTINEVLGVFGEEVHVRGNGCVLVMPEKVYLKVWKNWLAGKRNYCERFDHYCGVAGYTEPIKYFKPEGQIILNEFSFPDDDSEDCIVTEVPNDVYFVTKFDDYHNFEHG